MTYEHGPSDRPEQQPPHEGDNNFDSGEHYENAASGMSDITAPDDWGHEGIDNPDGPALEGGDWDIEELFAELPDHELTPEAVQEAWSLIEQRATEGMNNLLGDRVQFLEGVHDGDPEYMYVFRYTEGSPADLDVKGEVHIANERVSVVNTYKFKKPHPDSDFEIEHETVAAAKGGIAEAHEPTEAEQAERSRLEESRELARAMGLTKPTSQQLDALMHRLRTYKGRE